MDEREFRRGITTNEAFAEALKEKGSPVAYHATAETMRDAFAEISGEEITFNATDETVSEKVLNSSVEPTEKVSITFTVAGLEAGDEPNVRVGEEVITELPATLEENKGTELSYSVTCTGYQDAEGTLVFDTNKEITVTMEKNPTPVIATSTYSFVDGEDNPVEVEIYDGDSKVGDGSEIEFNGEEGTTKNFTAKAEGYEDNEFTVTYGTDGTVVMVVA